MTQNCDIEGSSVAKSNPNIKVHPRRSNEVIEVITADFPKHLDTSYRRRAKQFGIHPSNLWKLYNIRLHDLYTECKWHK